MREGRRPPARLAKWMSSARLMEMSSRAKRAFIIRSPWKSAWLKAISGWPISRNQATLVAS